MQIVYYFAIFTRHPRIYLAANKNLEKKISVNQKPKCEYNKLLFLALLLRICSELHQRLQRISIFWDFEQFKIILKILSAIGKQFRNNISASRFHSKLLVSWVKVIISIMVHFTAISIDRAFSLKNHLEKKA